MLTITYLIKRMPTKSLNSKTLIDILKQHLPHINCRGSLPPKVFGYTIFVSMNVCFFLKTSPITRNMIFKGRKYCKKISLRCPLPFWSHATEHGDVEQVDNIQPAIGKETNIIKPVVVENATKHGDVEGIDNIQPATSITFPQFFIMNCNWFSSHRWNGRPRNSIQPF